MIFSTRGLGQLSKVRGLGHFAKIKPPTPPPIQNLRFFWSPPKDFKPTTTFTIGGSFPEKRMNSIGLISNRAFVRNLHTEAKKHANLILESLPSVHAIRESIYQNQVAVVMGAPGSGKTEQIECALSSEFVAYNLKEEFVDHWSKKEGLSTKQEDLFWREGYYEIKDEELSWLKTNFNDILARLKQSDQTNILLDEFDLGQGTSLTQTEQETCKLIFKLGEELKKEGKNVLVVLHHQATHTPGIKKALEEHQLLEKNERWISTKYFSKDQEQRILIEAGFDTREANLLSDVFQGIPGAYLHLMKGAEETAMDRRTTLPEANLIQFYQKAKTQIRNNYRRIQKVNDKETINALKSLALKKENPPEDLKQPLLETGLVTLQGEEIVMPKIVQNIIQEEQIPKVTYTAEGILEEFDDPLEVDKRLAKAPSDIKDSVKLLCELGGCHVIMGSEKSQYIVYPKSKGELDFLWSIRSNEIGKFLATEELREEVTDLDHLEWQNSASTINELTTNAKTCKESFIHLIEGICHAVHGTKCTGENDKFVLKTEERIRDKVNRWTVPGGNQTLAIKGINDALRGTVIVDDLDQLKESLRIAANKAEENGYEIVFSNKFNEDYSSGYVGVHAKVKLRHQDDQGEEVETMAEIQFHLKKIFDGTDQCIKEQAHGFYQIQQEGEIPALALDLGMKALYTVGMDGVYKRLLQQKKLNLKL